MLVPILILCVSLQKPDGATPFKRHEKWQIIKRHISTYILLYILHIIFVKCQFLSTDHQIIAKASYSYKLLQILFACKFVASISNKHKIIRIILPLSLSLPPLSPFLPPSIPPSPSPLSPLLSFHFGVLMKSRTNWSLLLTAMPAIFNLPKSVHTSKQWKRSIKERT